MIHSIKNISEDTINLASFSIKKGESIPLVWEEGICTPEMFGLLLLHYNNKGLSFTDEEGKKIKKSKKLKYYKLSKAKNKRLEKLEEQTYDLVILELNELYNQYINQLNYGG